MKLIWRISIEFGGIIASLPSRLSAIMFMFKNSDKLHFHFLSDKIHFKGDREQTKRVFIMDLNSHMWSELPDMFMLQCRHFLLQVAAKFSYSMYSQQVFDSELNR